MSMQNRDARKYAEVDVFKKRIDQANSVSILDIFNHYNLNIDSSNRKITCPFISHEGGNERSASFWYYPDTNSFYCFGCKNGGGPVEFVSVYEGIVKFAASKLILSKFSTSTDYVENTNNYLNNYKLHLEFSHSIREFIYNNDGSSQAVSHAEYISSAFDDMMAKYNLEPQGLYQLVSKLKGKLTINE